jgi:Flp pilus assembly protein TadD
MTSALYVRNGLWASRYGLWNDAAAKSPGKARPWAQLALAQQERGRIDDAIQAYGWALERVRPTDAELEVQVRRNLSAALVSTGRGREALSVLQRASELAPANAEIATNLGLALLQEGDLDGARSWIDRALRLDPALPEAHGLRGSILLRQGDAAAAAVAFGTATRLAPDEGAHAFNQGVALERLGRIPEACSSWRRSLQLRCDRVLAERIARKVAQRCP